MLGASVTVLRNDSAELTDEVISRFNAIVISPGPGRPDHAGLSKNIIRTYTGRIPILGVCLGMQCINEVNGGITLKAQVPVHGKTSEITHDNSDLFEGMPSPFTAARYHSLIISDIKGLTVTSQTSDNIPMSVSVPGKNVWGIQFHPESFMTPWGLKILENFLKQC